MNGAQYIICLVDPRNRTGLQYLQYLPMISFIKASGCGAGLHLWPCLKAIQQKLQSVELSYKSISSATEQLCLLQSMCGLSGVFLKHRGHSLSIERLWQTAVAAWQHAISILLASCLKKTDIFSCAMFCSIRSHRRYVLPTDFYFISPIKGWPS